MAALFPDNEWLRWVSQAATSDSSREASIVTAYLRKKLEESRFHLDIEMVVDDFILYGNAFALSEYVNTETYSGPKVRRISPMDIVFDPFSSSFSATPKIVRQILPRDEFVSQAKANGKMNISLVNKAIGDQSYPVVSDRMEDRQYIDGLTRDGLVEILTYFGPVGNGARGSVIVVNRREEVYRQAYPEWVRNDPVTFTRWRSRPDTLWGMSPLDNILGLQWRICHLENLRSDVFDQISLPMVVVKGEVHDFTYEPGTIITLGDDGAVSYLTPPTEALAADTQIALIEQRMEEMAGAPKMAMGFRTPGEKTAFEVQTLVAGANKVFMHKAERFEREFLIPLLESMLEMSRRFMTGSEIVTYGYPEIGGNVNVEVTREMLNIDGNLKAFGSSRFAKQAKAAQELLQLLTFKQIPDIGIHLSGKRIAQKISQAVDDPDLFVEHAGVVEQAEIQKTAMDVEADMMEEMQVRTEQGL